MQGPTLPLQSNTPKITPVYPLPELVDTYSTTNGSPHKKSRRKSLKIQNGEIIAEK